jgi:hypothetical protein
MRGFGVASLLSSERLWLPSNPRSCMDELNFIGLKDALMFIAILTLRSLVLLLIYPLWFWFLWQVFAWLR